MVVLPQIIKLKWTNPHKKYYESKGYIFTGVHTEFYVDVLDLKPTSKMNIDVLCDYCNEIFHPTYDNYLKSKKNKYCFKDCCKECSPLKLKDVTLVKYGVESTNQLKDVIEKKRKSMVLPKDMVEQEFINRGYILLSEYINSEIPLEYICPKHKDEGIKTINYHHLKRGQGCKSCGRERISGEKHYNWNGGITELNIYLRDRLREWTFDSLKNGDFKCDITGISKKLEVHHLHNFRDIVIETLNNLNFVIKPKVVEYTKSELELIIEECVRLHYHYGFGVVLSTEIHKEFHNKYGKINNTKEQYFEFKSLKLLEFAS